MVSAGTFRPVDWNDINWQKEGVLYRGTIEGRLVSRLSTTASELRPSYFALGTYGKEMFTHTSPSLDDALWYSTHRIDEAIMAREHEMWPWSRPVYPLVMKINAEPYRCSLGVSTVSGDGGIIIKGPIYLDDIEILSSSKMSRLDEKSNGIIARGLGRVGEKHSIQKDGFLEEFEKNPEAVRSLFFAVKRSYRDYHSEATEDDMRAFERFVHSVGRLE